MMRHGKKLCAWMMSFIVLFFICVPVVDAEDVQTKPLEVRLVLDGDILIDNSQSVTLPVYTVKVNVENGTLTEELKSDMLRLDGAFEKATIQNVNTSEDRTSFTVIFNKTVDTDPGRMVQGHLEMDADKVTPSKEAVINADTLSLSLADAYTVDTGTEDTQSESSIEASIDEKLKKNLNKEMSKMPTTVIMDLVKEFSKDLFPGVGAFNSLLGGTLNGIFSIFGLGESDDKTAEKLDEISNKLDNVSDKIDSATEEILGAVDRNRLSSKLDAVADDARALKNNQNHNNTATKAITLTQQHATDAESLAVIKLGFTNVYNTENTNYAYYDALTDYGYAIVGDKTIMENIDVFTLYKGCQAYAFDWNTLTFDNRSQFNDAVTKLFLGNYAVVQAALEYDIAMHNSELSIQQEYVKTLNAAINEGSLTTEQIKEELDKANGRIGQLKSWIDQAGEDIKVLETLKDNVAERYQEATDVLNAEKQAATDGGKIYNYRVRKNYQQNIHAYGAKWIRGPLDPDMKNPFEGSRNPNASLLSNTVTETDLNAMKDGALHRGYKNLYEEILAAGFNFSNASKYEDDLAVIKEHYPKGDIPIGFVAQKSARYKRSGNNIIDHNLDYYVKWLNINNNEFEEILVAYEHHKMTNKEFLGNQIGLLLYQE